MWPCIMNPSKSNRIYAYIKYQNVAIKTSHQVPICGILFFQSKIYQQKKINQNPFYVTKALVMNDALIWSWLISVVTKNRHNINSQC